MSETHQAEIPQFMAMRYSWPIDSCANASFSIRKGEIIRIPGGMRVDENMFATFATYEKALAFVRQQPTELPPSERITSTETLNSKLRKVRYLGDDGKTAKEGFIIKDKDIPEELSQNARDVIKDIEKLDDDESLMKMLEVEQRCDKRKAVIEKLKDKLKL